MVQARPYAERVTEFRPFACSDFIIPMLTKLCPPGEKMDRYERGCAVQLSHVNLLRVFWLTPYTDLSEGGR